MGRIPGAVDDLDGLKENVIVGHLIPAGTGNRSFEKVIVGSMDEYKTLMQAYRNGRINDQLKDEGLEFLLDHWEHEKQGRLICRTDSASPSRAPPR